MLLSKYTLTGFTLLFSICLAASLDAQQTRFNPGTQVTPPYTGQPGQRIYDAQLGVTFTRIDIQIGGGGSEGGGGESRPSLHYNPGNGGGATVRVKGLQSTPSDSMGWVNILDWSRAM